MSDELPRVLELTYEMLVEDENPDRYEGSIPVVDRRIGDFDCTLENYVLTAKPVVRFADYFDAVEAFEPHVRGWESHYELFSHVRVRFRRTGGLYLQLDEESGEEERVDVTVLVGGEMPHPVPVEGEVHESHYPFPPATPYIESLRLRELRERYMDLRLGRDRLLAFGYYLLTAVESDYGTGGGSKKRETAAKALNVEVEVLNKLGELTSERDHERHGRKAGKDTPLSFGEDQWLWVVIPTLLRQIGFKEGDGELKRLTMRQFASALLR